MPGHQIRATLSCKTHTLVHSGMPPGSSYPPNYPPGQGPPPGHGYPPTSQPGYPGYPGGAAGGPQQYPGGYPNASGPPGGDPYRGGAYGGYPPRPGYPGAPGGPPTSASTTPPSSYPPSSQPYEQYQVGSTHRPLSFWFCVIFAISALFCLLNAPENSFHFTPLAILASNSYVAILYI